MLEIIGEVLLNVVGETFNKINLAKVAMFVFATLFVLTLTVMIFY